uniref:synaptonemal complex protein 1-like isoform X4 n=1 Tax=Pristiophorus japonicus TaxID=55135 RepID=UPI00398EEB95
MKENANLKEEVQSKESVLSEMQGQIMNALAKERDCFEKLNSLKTGLEEEREKHEKLCSDYNILLSEKATLSQNLSNGNAEIKDLQKKLETVEHKEESAKKEIEVLKEQNNQQKEELKALDETLKQQDQETDSKLGEKEESSKHLQNEVKKKEKLLKAMENKLNSLKKQLENKNKSTEELNQENKSLKKKFIEETRHCSVYKTEMKQLNLELTDLNKQYEESIQSFHKEIEEVKLEKEKLTEEVKALKFTAEAALKSQKETEIMCQNKIAEMVTLMEKHKEVELLAVKGELSGVKQELKKVTEEKEGFAKQTKTMKGTVKSLKDELKKKVESNSKLKNLSDNASNCEVPSTPVRKNSLSTASKSAELFKESGRASIIQRTHTWTPAEKTKIVPNHQTYTIRTPPIIQNKILKGTMKPPCGEVLQKKRKVVLDLDTHSDSSEHSDLLSMIPESEMFRELYKGNSEAAYLFGRPLQQLTSPAKPKTYGSALKLIAVKKMREAGWEAVTKESRKKRMKIAEKIF